MCPTPSRFAFSTRNAQAGIDRPSSPRTDHSDGPNQRWGMSPPTPGPRNSTGGAHFQQRYDSERWDGLLTSPRRVEADTRPPRRLCWHPPENRGISVRGRGAQDAGSLSGGEQQMLSLARALVPELLLLNEPSLGRSPGLVGAAFEMMAEINRDCPVPKACGSGSPPRRARLPLPSYDTYSKHTRCTSCGAMPGAGSWSSRLASALSYLRLSSSTSPTSFAMSRSAS